MGAHYELPFLLLETNESVDSRDSQRLTMETITAITNGDEQICI